MWDLVVVLLLALMAIVAIWSLLIIAVDMFVIWALAAHGGALRDTTA
jgi:hypothetical protein